MAARLIQLADAAVTALAAAGLSQPVTVQRSYLPTFELSTEDGVKISVFPEAEAREVATRDKTARDYSLSIGVQKKLAQADAAAELAEVDGLLQLVEEVSDAITGGVGAPWLWIGTAHIPPLYLPEHLIELRTFTSVLIVTYRQIV